MMEEMYLYNHPQGQGWKQFSPQIPIDSPSSAYVIITVVLLLRLPLCFHRNIRRLSLLCRVVGGINNAHVHAILKSYQRQLTRTFNPKHAGTGQRKRLRKRGLGWRSNHERRAPVRATHGKWGDARSMGEDLCNCEMDPAHISRLPTSRPLGFAFL